MGLQQHDETGADDGRHHGDKQDCSKGDEIATEANRHVISGKGTS